MNNASNSTVATIKIIGVGDASGPWACDITYRGGDVEAATDSHSAWVAANNRGEGFEVGEPGCDINHMATVLGGVLIHKSAGSYEVAVYEVPA